MIVNNTAGSIKLCVLFLHASCVPPTRAASERPTSRPALCFFIAQRCSRRGTFNGTRGEHMDNISLRRRLFAESSNLCWQPARRTGCEERACGQREVQGGWTGSASGRREGGNRNEVTHIQCQNCVGGFLPMGSFCLIDPQDHCFKSAGSRVTSVLTSHLEATTTDCKRQQLTTDPKFVFCVQKGDTAEFLFVYPLQSAVFSLLLLSFFLADTNTAVVFAVSGRITTGPARCEVSLEQIIFPALAEVRSAVTQARLHSAWTSPSPDGSVPFQLWACLLR